MKARVLVIDDEQYVRSAISKLVRESGYDVQCARDGREGLDMIETDQIDVALVDMHMPHMRGIEVLRQASRSRPNTVCIVVTGDGDIDLANRCLELGAFDYLEKPIGSLKQFGQKLKRAAEVARLRWETDAMRRDDPAERLLLGNSETMVSLRQRIRQVAASKANIQIRGESGTGKEVVARVLHQMSGRGGRFIGVNCGAFTSGLEEDHLFGHVRGGFTGAVDDYEGVFSAAADGTILLDEIGDMPLPLQVKLLRALEERKFSRVGSTDLVPLTARIITATHRDLAREVKEGNFREDLFYRLDVVTLTVPPLRDRREDIRPLSLRFVHEFNQSEGRQVRRVAAEAMALLEQAPWPGNVRQLRNEIYRAVLIAPGNTLTPDLLFENARPRASAAPVGPAFDEALLALPWNDAKGQVLEIFARVYLTHHLEQAGHVVARAARTAGMARPNFARLLKRYGLSGRDT